MPTPYRRRGARRLLIETVPKVGNGLFALLIGGGFAAIVAGAFGVGGDMLKRPDAAVDRQCTAATQVLLDEAPNPYISKSDMQTIGRAAARRSMRCITGDGR